MPLLLQGGVAVYSVGGDGKLTEVAGSPFVLGVSDAPYSAKAHPTGKFLYVTDRANDELYAATVGADGKLTVIGTGAALDGYPYQIIMDPQGRFVYVSVASEGYAIDGFKIDQATGALTPVPTFPAFITGSEPRGGTIDSTGKYLILADKGDGDVRVYSIDQTTGDLTQVGAPVPTGGDGSFQVVEQTVGSTNYVFVNNYYSGSLAVFTFDAGAGTLTAITNSPFDLGLNSPHWIAVDPSGKFGYVANADSSAPAIGAATLNSNGTFTDVVGSPFTQGVPDHPNQIVFIH